MKNGRTVHEVSENTVWIMSSLCHSDGYSIKIGLSQLRDMNNQIQCEFITSTVHICFAPNLQT